MNRKRICYLILLLVQVLGALFSSIYALIRAWKWRESLYHLICQSLQILLHGYLFKSSFSRKNLEKTRGKQEGLLIYTLFQSSSIFWPERFYCFVWYGGGDETLNFNTQRLSWCRLIRWSGLRLRSLLVEGQEEPQYWHRSVDFMRGSVSYSGRSDSLFTLLVRTSIGSFKSDLYWR